MGQCNLRCSCVQIVQSYSPDCANLTTIQHTVLGPTKTLPLKPAYNWFGRFCRVIHVPSVLWLLISGAIEKHLPTYTDQWPPCVATGHIHATQPKIVESPTFRLKRVSFFVYQLISAHLRTDKRVAHCSVLSAIRLSQNKAQYQLSIAHNHARMYLNDGCHYYDRT